MGKIVKQSVINTVLSYVGIAIGTFYTLFIVPKVFAQNPGEWGLIQLINSFVMLFLPFALLGFPNIIIKYWSKYYERQNNEFSFFLLVLVTAGMLVVSLIMWFLRNEIFASEADTSGLMMQYVPHFMVIFALNLYFYFLLNFARVYHKTIFPTFLKDTFIKIWTFGLILLYQYAHISFNTFFYLFFAGYVVMLLAVIVYIKQSTTIKLKPNFRFLKNKADLKEILMYGLYSILAGGAGVLVLRADVFMINKLIDLNNVAFYSVALFFVTVIQVPMRSVTTISIPIISDHFYNQNHSKVQQIYSETGTTLLLVSSFVFMAIAVCINEFMTILGPQFGQIKYVVLILGMAKVFEAVNTMNQTILIVSRYFKYDILFQIMLLALTVLTNLYFIPRYGINGAAIASAISIVLNNMARTWFIWAKFGLKLYNIKHLYVLAICAMSALAMVLFTFNMNVYLAMLLKGMFVSMVFLIFSLWFNISGHFNHLFNQTLDTVGLTRYKIRE